MNPFLKDIVMYVLGAGAVLTALRTALKPVVPLIRDTKKIFSEFGSKPSQQKVAASAPPKEPAEGSAMLYVRDDLKKERRAVLVMLLFSAASLSLKVFDGRPPTKADIVFTALFVGFNVLTVSMYFTTRVLENVRALSAIMEMRTIQGEKRGDSGT